jgi:hypothetical protein
MTAPIVVPRPRKRRRSIIVPIDAPGAPAYALLSAAGKLSLRFALLARTRRGAWVA